MFLGKKISVVIPAYNEEKLIIKTLESIPNYIDRIVVIDDFSVDDTILNLKMYQRFSPKLILLRNSKNLGVGASIILGYKKSVQIGCDIAVVIAADLQMNTLEIADLVTPIIKEKVDYIKGNRFLDKKLFDKMPKGRLIGNFFLSYLTKITSGYWHIMDSQCGFTAINLNEIYKVKLDDVYPRYGFPNDFLNKLNVANFSVGQVKVSTVYGEEKSGFNAFFIIPKIFFLLIKGFYYRIWQKYFIQDFSFLLLFYLLGMFLTLTFLFEILTLNLLKIDKIFHIGFFGVFIFVLTIIFDLLKNSKLKAN